MKQSLSVGIDIGSSMTRVVVTESVAPDGGHPRVLALGTAETRGVRHGYVINREDATSSLLQAIREAERELGTRIKSAAIAISGIGLESAYSTGNAIASRADGIISKLDIEKAIQDAENQIDLKNKAILHAFPVLFKVDGKELPTRPDGMQGLKLEVKTLFITCFRQHLDDVLNVVADAGVKVTSFTATPIATQKLLLTDLQRNFGCALIDIGAETVSVSVYENNTLTTLHVFGIGSLDITKDIALGLRITPEEAESIKLGTVSFQSVPKKKLDEIVEARLSDIFELVDKFFKKIGRSGLLPAGAIIIGGGSLGTMIEPVAKTMLKIPVRMGHVDLPSTKTPIKDPRYLLAYAIATNNSEPTNGKRRSTTSSTDNEGFIAVIRDFFKQLMP
ncbi:cell division protein FtsA [Patescibacteria group bacterium]|nr:cell division protein FtsA [Patescibacteria group bacterium]